MDRIPRIFVIHLPHREDRLISIKNELERMGLIDKMEIVNGVIIDGFPVSAIAEAHARCLELAQQRGYEMIMVLQDDCKFLVDKEIFHNEIQTFLDTAPPDWNGFWFGSMWQSSRWNEYPSNYVKPFLRLTS